MFPAVAGGVVYFGGQDSYQYAVDAQTGVERWRFEMGAAAILPAVADGVVYFGSSDCNLYTLDAQSGAERWRFQTVVSIWLSPAVGRRGLLRQR